MNSLSLDETIISKVPFYLLKEFRVVPLRVNENELLVAISEAHHLLYAKQLEAFYNINIKGVLVTPTNLDTLFEYIENKHRKKEVLGADKDIFYEKNEDEEVLIADSPAVKLADSLLREAVAANASDIHIEPFEEYVKIRFRIDGHLIENSKFSRSIYQQLLARFKIIADLNIAERRVPQDGKIKLTINQLDYDFRISTLPTIYGEKIVIRIYSMEKSTQIIDKLGFSKKQLYLIKSMISRPHGIILVTGPTGSGKSTSLYTFLKALNKTDVNVITVEDPVENIIEGINQIQVNPKANLTFFTALRSILRQDPNIIMIGEIRDEETAQMAVRAAITGHLVFSTLHTNDAIGSITRMVDMGIPRYLLADAMVGAISQRLVRKLCPHCKEKVFMTNSEKQRLKVDRKKYLYIPKGCSECYYTGYRGRQAVFEVVDFDQKLKQLVENPASSMEEIRAKVEENFICITDSCKKLVLEGITSMEEYDALLQFNDKNFSTNIKNLKK